MDGLPGLSASSPALLSSLSAQCARHHKLGVLVALPPTRSPIYLPILNPRSEEELYIVRSAETIPLGPGGKYSGLNGDMGQAEGLPSTPTMLDHSACRDI